MTQQIDMTRIPAHIAIIMDGNGRWAMDRGLDRPFGHKAGAVVCLTLPSLCHKCGEESDIENLSHTFSLFP